MEGIWARSWRESGSQSFERFSALAQCRKTSSTVTRMPTTGCLPLTVQAESRAASSVIRALPLSLSVSSKPGTKNSRPTFGLAVMLAMVSSRLLPGRSGMRMVLSSMTWTKPGGSPRGERSARPCVSAVEMTRKGDRPMNWREYLSSAGRLLAEARCETSPYFARSSSSSLIITPSRSLCGPRLPSGRGPSRRCRTSRGSRRS